MGRLVHARGDLQMTVEGIDVDGHLLQIRGQMGVWDAQILFEPEEVATMARAMINLRMLRYLVMLPFTLRSRARARASTTPSTLSAPDRT